LLLQIKFFNIQNIYPIFISVATERKQLGPLFEVLSECDRQWDGSPFREFKICAVRKTGRGTETLSCVFDVQFKDDGKIGLWNTTMDEKNILDINMSCLDKLVLFKMIYATQ
jgi:hypothetical protein